MATLQDFQADLQAVLNGVGELASEIAELKKAPKGVVSQEELDALDSQAQAILSAIAAAK